MLGNRDQFLDGAQVLAGVRVTSAGDDNSRQGRRS